MAGARKSSRGEFFVAEGEGAAMAAEAGDSRKEILQRQMNEARESLTQTVTDIKDTVVGQVQAVKDSVTETLDWREQVRSHPVVWCIGALSIGYVLGNSVIAALQGARDEDHLLSHLAALGEQFTDELSKQGMNILAPALTGTVLVPVLTGKIKELTGLDLTDLAQGIFNQDSAPTKSKRNGKKKAGGKKRGKKKKKGKSGKI